MKPTRGQGITIIPARSEDDYDPNTREAAQKRQEKIDRDVAEFLAKGGVITNVDELTRATPSTTPKSEYGKNYAI